MFDSMDAHPWDDAEELALKAYELYENGEYSDALAQLEEAIEINPDNDSWFFNAGLTLDAMNNFKAAIASYKAALKLKPDDPEIMNSLAVDYTRIGMYDLALEIFEKIELIDPGFEPCYCNRIITYAEIDRHDMAEQMFYMAQQINPQCPICFYNIGNSLFSQREFKRAIWCWQKTAELEPTHPQINYRIAQAYWADGDKNQAQEYFLVELRRNPGDSDVILDFGVFLLDCGNIESAREKFNRILEMNPGSARANLYLGEIALYMGQKTRAWGFFGKSREIDPTLCGPGFRLAQIALEDGNNKDAEYLLQSEMRLNVEDPDVLISIGSMLTKLEEFDLAMDCFLRVVDEDSSNSRAFYYMGKNLVLQGEIEGGGYFFEHAIELGCNDPDLLFDASKFYYKTGNPSEALRTVEAFKKVARDHGDIHSLEKKINRAQFIIRIKSGIFGRMIEKMQLLAARNKCRLRRFLERLKS